MTEDDKIVEAMLRAYAERCAGTGWYSGMESALAAARPLIERGIREAALREAADKLPTYDAGLLSDWGGGDIKWWQDYIRAELECAHEFYQVAVRGRQ